MREGGLDGSRLACQMRNRKVRQIRKFLQREILGAELVFGYIMVSKKKSKTGCCGLSRDSVEAGMG